MINLHKVLKETKNGTEYKVVFKCGDELGLKDFEAVDESIYNQNDIYVAWVVSQISCDKRFYAVGTGIQFSIAEVKKIESNDGDLLYESSMKMGGVR